MDLWDIPIAAITEQYLAYLYSLQEKDLAITGEFLVMAATLIRIKSRMLLPQEPPEDETLEESEDPRTELVQQLVRYKFFKEAAVFSSSAMPKLPGSSPGGRGSSPTT